MMSINFNFDDQTITQTTTSTAGLPMNTTIQVTNTANPTFTGIWSPQATANTPLPIQMYVPDYCQNTWWGDFDMPEMSVDDAIEGLKKIIGDLS